MTTDPTDIWKRARVEQSRKHIVAGQHQARRQLMRAALQESRRPADVPARDDDRDAASLRRGMLT